MSLSEDQIVRLEQLVKLELSYLEGDKESIIAALEWLSKKEEKSYENSPELKQVRTICAMLAEPYRQIGVVILSIHGEFETRRQLKAEDHEEAIAIIKKEIFAFLETDPCILPGEPQEDTCDSLPTPSSPPFFPHFIVSPPSNEETFHTEITYLPGRLRSFNIFGTPVGHSW